jgi:hypothetical protein
VKRPLRVFLCSQQSLKRHPVPEYRFWARYFQGGLAEAGHSFVEAPNCDWAEGLLPLDDAARSAWLEHTWQLAIAALREEHARRPVDLFLSYLFPGQVSAGGLGEIRALGIPSVNFFCDNVREFREVPRAFAGFDLHWVPEHKAVPLYRRAQLPFLHAPMPCFVPTVWRVPVAEEPFAVTFVGTADEQRRALFAEAIDLGLAIELRGTGWGGHDAPAAPPRGEAHSIASRLTNQVAFARQQGIGALARKLVQAARGPRTIAHDFGPSSRPAPDGDDYWRVLRGSTVCVGVNRYPSLRHPFSRPDTYSRLRDIEAPMTGACYLTEWTEGLDGLYDLGSEIESYRGASELVEKSRALEKDASRRLGMRTAAQRRALADHSIGRTMEKIASRLNLGG